MVCSASARACTSGVARVGCCSRVIGCAGGLVVECLCCALVLPLHGWCVVSVLVPVLRVLFVWAVALA
jgi:hypothetical protein